MDWCVDNSIDQGGGGDKDADAGLARLPAS